MDLNKVSTLLFTTLVLTLSFVAILHSEDKEPVGLLWPFKDFHSISSNFGENRPGHIHMGLDIRIGGQLGVPAMAVGDGYVSRVKVKPNGYGKALYLTLTDGRTAVYAHLDSFSPEIQKYVEAAQWQTHNFSQDLFPDKDLFPLKQGETAAFAGRSGTKGPHLHFEIRSAKNEAQNPLTHGLNIKDSKAPLFDKVALIPLQNDSEVDSDCKPKVYKIERAGSGAYTLKTRPAVYGITGLAVKYRDFTDEAPYSIAAFSLIMMLDDSVKFTLTFDECDYYSYLDVEVDRDPYLKRAGQGKFQRLFKISGNDMPIYSGEGQIDSRKVAPGTHKISIIASDYYSNKSVLDFEIEVLPEAKMPAPTLIDTFQSKSRENLDDKITKPSYSIEFMKDWARIEIADAPGGLHWLDGREYLLNTQVVNGKNVGRIQFSPEITGLNFLYSTGYGVLESWTISHITRENGGQIESPDKKLRIEFPPNGVYEDMFCNIQPIEISGLPGGFNYVSETAYSLSPEWIPLKKRASIYWDTKDTTGQTGIYYLDMKEGPTFLGNEFTAGEVAGECLNLETLFLIADKESPRLNMLNPNPGKPVNKNLKMFKFELIDKLSGIDFDMIEAEVDGNWALPEYDPPRDKLYVHIREPLETGKHVIKVSVPDKSRNMTVRTWNINTK